MENDRKDATGAKKKRKEKGGEPLGADDLAKLVATLSRLSTHLASNAPWKDSGLSVGQWTLMSSLMTEAGTKAGLVREIGVTRKQIDAICSELAAAGFVTVGERAQDSRDEPVTLTPAGIEKVEAINAAITPVLQRALADKQAILERAAHSLKILTRALTEQKTDTDKQARRDKKAARLARTAERSGAQAH